MGTNPSSRLDAESACVAQLQVHPDGVGCRWSPHRCFLHSSAAAHAVQLRMVQLLFNGVHAYFGNLWHCKGSSYRGLAALTASANAGEDFQQYLLAAFAAPQRRTQQASVAGRACYELIGH